MLIRDVMSTRFATIHPDATLREAATAFQAEPDHGGVPNLLVMEGDRLLGLVTLTDVLRVLLPPSIERNASETS
jgi:CBS domain-containing protein